MKNRWIRPLKFAAVFITVLSAAGFTSPAFAQVPAKTLGDMTNSVYDSLISLQFFLSLISYCLGTFFSITGLQQLRNYVDSPDKTPVHAMLLRLGAAAFFIFAPTAAMMLVKSLGLGGMGDKTQLLTEGTGVITGNVTTTGQGLDEALTRFVIDFAGPFLDNLLPVFAYICGIIFMLVGLKRLAMANGDGPQAPGGLGTMGTFVVAAALMAFGYIMYTMQGSIFGTTQLYTNQAVVSPSADAALQGRFDKALWGVFIFLRIVGYISVLRGVFMLRGVAEGGNVSMMAVGTHLIAGSLLANMGAFVNAIQYSFIQDPANFVFKNL
jgi:hypothetical protein